MLMCRMGGARDHPGGSLAPCAINIAAAVQHLANGIAQEKWSANGSLHIDRLSKKAWSILLDLDPTCTQEELQAGKDGAARTHSNSIAAAQACCELKDAACFREVEGLQQLIADWLSTNQYMPWMPASHKQQAAGTQSAKAALSEQQAVLSVLLALRGSRPPAVAKLVTLPALGSSAVATLQRRAEAAVVSAAPTAISAGHFNSCCGSHSQAASGAGLQLFADHVQQQQQIAAQNNWLSATAAAAVQLAAQAPLSPGSTMDGAAGNRQQAAEGDESTADLDSSLPMLQRTLLQMQLASSKFSPYRSLGAASSKRSQGALVPHNSTATTHNTATSRAAVEAGNAVAVVTAAQPGVLALMLQSNSVPGKGKLALLGQMPAATVSAKRTAGRQDVPTHSQRAQGWCQQQQQQRKGQRQLRVAEVQPAPSSQAVKGSASRTAAEEQLVSLSCLAVQGVWSAVGQLREIAACNPTYCSPYSRRPGLLRPATAHNLIVQVLHMAEMRLRLQAFVQHFSNSKNRSNNSSSSSNDAGGSSNADGLEDAVLDAFFGAAKGVLALHNAAVQVLQQQQQQQQLAKHRPSVTLLWLVAQLRDMRMQLDLLVHYCWCTASVTAAGDTAFKWPSTAANWGGEEQSQAFSSGNVTDRHWRYGRNLAGSSLYRHGGCDPAAYAAASVLPWPAQAAAYVEAWGWQPSRWQVERGFFQGKPLLEHLYSELLHAGPQSARLLGHLFEAAVQPVLCAVHNWTFTPDICVAEAAVAAVAVQSTARFDFKGIMAPATLQCAPQAARTADAMAAELLLQAWNAAPSRAPICPDFLAGVQHQVLVAGLQLQLLQLLGGAGQQLAQRLGWLAEMEQQELQEAFVHHSKRQTGNSSSTYSCSFGYDKGLCMSSVREAVHDQKSAGSLLLGHVLASPNKGGSGGCCRGYLSCSLTTQQLQRAAAIVLDYETAREAEVTALMDALVAESMAGVAKQQQQVNARHQDRLAADEQRRQLHQQAGIRRAERKRQLLLQQQEDAAAQAARRIEFRQQELAFERSLLTQAGESDRQTALRQLEAELRRAAAVGLDTSHLQACLSTEQATTGRVQPGRCMVADSTALTKHTGVFQPGTDVTTSRVQQGLVAGAVNSSSHDIDDGVAATALAAGKHLPQQQLEEQHSMQQHRQQVHQQAPCKRANWGQAVLDPSPAAGLPSSQAAAGASSVDLLQQEPSATSANNVTSSSSSSFGCSGGGSHGASRHLRANRAPAVLPASKWGVPLDPAPAAGQPSGYAKSLQQQQQQQQRNNKKADGHVAALSTQDIDLQCTDGALAVVSQQNGLRHTGDNDVAFKTGISCLEGGSSIASQQLGSSNALLETSRGLHPLQHLKPVPAGDGGTVKGSQADSAYQSDSKNKAAAATATAAPLITTFEMLAVGPLLSQHRLTTLACWQLLLHEHHLLRQVAALQDIFFQQQGDWVDLLCEGLEQHMPLSALAGQPAADAVATVAHASGSSIASAAGSKNGLSPVIAAVLLESAVQQSCLAGSQEADRLSLQVEPDRLLPGWSGSSHTTSNAAAATDVLLLSFEVPWPPNLLVGSKQQQQYAQVFSVLLRFRRLQRLLTQQWAALNGRASKLAQHLQYQAAEERSDQQPVGQLDLKQLGKVRRWHATALHSVSSLLGYMLGELSGSLRGDFERVVSMQPVSLPEMVEAHDKLLVSAQQVCLLPQANGGVDSSSGSSSRCSTGGGSSDGSNSMPMSQLVYQLIDIAWYFQQQLQQVLTVQIGSGAVPGSLTNDREQLAETAWEQVAAAGFNLDGRLKLLKRQLKGDAAAALGSRMSGLAARLGE